MLLSLHDAVSAAPAGPGTDVKGINPTAVDTSWPPGTTLTPDSEIVDLISKADVYPKWEVRAGIQFVGDTWILRAEVDHMLEPNLLKWTDSPVLGISEAVMTGPAFNNEPWKIPLRVVEGRATAEVNWRVFGESRKLEPSAWPDSLYFIFRMPYEQHTVYFPIFPKLGDTRTWWSHMDNAWWKLKPFTPREGPLVNDTEGQPQYQGATMSKVYRMVFRDTPIAFDPLIHAAKSARDPADTRPSILIWWNDTVIQTPEYSEYIKASLGESGIHVEEVRSRKEFLALVREPRRAFAVVGNREFYQASDPEIITTHASEGTFIIGPIVIFDYDKAWLAQYLGRLILSSFEDRPTRKGYRIIYY